MSARCLQNSPAWGGGGAVPALAMRPRSPGDVPRGTRGTTSSPFPGGLGGRQPAQAFSTSPG